MPEAEELRDLLENLVLDTLIDLLSAGEKALLKASTLFSIPVPLDILAKLGEAVGARSSDATGARLSALGLWEKAAKSGSADALVNSLVRARLARLNDGERRPSSARCSTGGVETMDRGDPSRWMKSSCGSGWRAATRAWSHYRLHWFDGDDAGGTWTLNLEDDTNNVNGGNLTGWSITVCAPPPPVPCPAGAYPVTVLAADFENAAAGFTHSGTLDQWALGTPAGSVIASCADGTKCFKTNLAGNYAGGSTSDLLSPSLALAGLVAPIRLRWAQKYQLESATNDHASVDLLPTGLPAQRIWEFLDATMTASVGLAPTTIQESAGWGIVETNLDS